MIVRSLVSSSSLLRSALALLGGLVAGGGCGRADVVVALHDQDAVRASAAWAELVVYPNGCRPPSDHPPTDAAFRVVVPADTEFPPIGDLDEKTYGFAAILRNADCRILAEGCTEANLERVGKINSFVATPTDTPAGCVGQCDQGTCRSGGAGGSAGAGGSSSSCLALQGEFPLPVAASASSTISPPVVMTTANGYLIAYRDRGGPGGRDTLSIVPVGKDGQITGAVAQQDLRACPGGAIRSNVGFGAAFDGTSGLLLGDLPACTGDAENQDFLVLQALDASAGFAVRGETRNDGARSAVTSGPSVISLASQGRFAVLFRVSAPGDTSDTPALAARLFVTSPNATGFDFKSAVTPVAGGLPSRFTVGAMLGTKSLRVLTGLNDGTLRMDSFDVSAVSGSTTAAVPTMGEPESLGPADVAAVASSELGIVIGQAAAKQLTLTTLRASGTRDALTAPASEAPLSLAVAANKTHAFFARGTKGAVALSAFAASAPKTEIKPPAFSLPSLGKWSGESLAMAAGQDGLLMAWTTSAGNATAAVGGYALFTCPAK